MTEQLSNCCKAHVYKNNYICSVCKQACDLQVVEQNQEKLCCLCNDILSDMEVDYFKSCCGICVDLNCTVVSNAEYERLKRLDENRKSNIEQLKKKNAYDKAMGGAVYKNGRNLESEIELLESLDK